MEQRKVEGRGKGGKGKRGRGEEVHRTNRCPENFMFIGADGIIMCWKKISNSTSKSIYRILLFVDETRSTMNL
jgi:hypothetical protein